MNKLLKPFVSIYHGVQATGRLPKKLFHKTEEAVENVQNSNAVKASAVP